MPWYNRIVLSYLQYSFLHSFKELYVPLVSLLPALLLRSEKSKTNAIPTYTFVENKEKCVQIFYITLFINVIDGCRSMYFQLGYPSNFEYFTQMLSPTNINYISNLPILTYFCYHTRNSKLQYWEKHKLRFLCNHSNLHISMWS